MKEISIHSVISYLDTDVPGTPEGQGEGTGESGSWSQSLGGSIGPRDQEPQESRGEGRVHQWFLNTGYGCRPVT